MPSMQSRVFRIVAKAISRRMDSIRSVGALRTMAGEGKSRPRLPRGTTIVPVTAGGVRAEWITPEDPTPDSTILYLHGGGWTLGLYDSHRMMVSRLCKDAGIRALAVDYRLAPEEPFPAALDDCKAVYCWLLEQGIFPGRIVVAGDSAGGNLALALLMTLRDSGYPLPSAAVLISPMTDLALSGESFSSAGDVLLSASLARKFAGNYAGRLDPRLPLISPLYGDFRGLPPLLIHCGGDEILLSDATRLADRASAAGVENHLVVWPGMWHVFHTFVPWLPEAVKAVGETGAFIRGRIG